MNDLPEEIQGKPRHRLNAESLSTAELLKAIMRRELDEPVEIILPTGDAQALIARVRVKLSRERAKVLRVRPRIKQFKLRSLSYHDISDPTIDESKLNPDRLHTPRSRVLLWRHSTGIDLAQEALEREANR